MVKSFQIEGLGTVKLYKRRASKNLRLRIDATGEIKLSMPWWTPYKSGLEFIWSKKDWLQRQQSGYGPLRHDMRVGKAHRLKLVACAVSSVSTRVSGNEIQVDYPSHLDHADKTVQAAARRAAAGALKKEAAKLLILRLNTLASGHGFDFNKLRFKQLKGRWGSCSSTADLTFNICLMHLPWDLIDYVLLHELTHIKVMNHGPAFWKKLETVLPDYKLRRKLIRTYRPVLAI